MGGFDVPQPVVAIVGRPNVGKSTLFNRIIRKRTAIEEKISGVTRDRIYGRAEWLDNYFIIIDTGGISFDEGDPLSEQIRKQALIAMEQASVIMMVVDLQNGVTSLDEEVAGILRKTKKKIILVGNKGESQHVQHNMYDFLTLGFGEPIMVSAAHGLNIGDLLDLVVNELPKEKDTVFEGLKVAIIGRPNVGKSSLTNYLSGEDRAIVSDIPGTTRDTVNTEITVNNKNYLLIDTAGLRRKSKVEEAIEYYSVLRSLRAIEDADIIVAIIDAVDGITEQDKKVIGYADASGKALVIAFNKWDLITNKAEMVKEFEKKAEDELVFVRYAPLIFISAQTGKRVNQMFALIDKAYEENTKRIPTSQLNSLLQEIIVLTPPPSAKGKSLKINYITQVRTGPPTFAIFVNNKEALHFSYVRHIENQLRLAYGFEGTPIRILVRTKKGRDDS